MQYRQAKGNVSQVADPQINQGRMFCDICSGRTDKLTNTGYGALVCDNCIAQGRK